MRIVDFFKKLFGHRSRVIEETRSIQVDGLVTILTTDEINSILAGYLSALIKSGRMKEYSNVSKFILEYYRFEVTLDYDLTSLKITEELKSLFKKFIILKYKYNDPKLSKYIEMYNN